MSAEPDPPEPERNEDVRPLASEPAATASVFAAAAAVIAFAEAVVLQERVHAADVAAAAAWAVVPADLSRIFQAEQTAWLAGQHAGALAIEHNRIARRSVLAATLAADALAAGLTAEEFAVSDLMREHIAAIVTARTVVTDSETARQSRQHQSPSSWN